MAFVSAGLRSEAREVVSASAKLSEVRMIFVFICEQCVGLMG
jgi:hypothetical protein